jgi:HEPN domain-containing protein
MRPEFPQDADPWLERAERDLLLAELALHSVPSLREATVFNSQQAAEKALKGFLAAHGTPARKTHELLALISACAEIESDFDALAEDATILTPYVSEYRYPGGPLEPSYDAARDAIQRARKIVDFVVAHIRVGQAGETSGT